MNDHDNNHDNNHDDLDQLREEGRRLANQRDDLIAAGVDPAELLIPLAPIEPAHRTEPAHDTPSTHTPGTAATSDARKRHTEQQTQTPARPPFGVSAFERAQWRRDSENDARGIVSLNARVLVLLDALDQAESALRTQKTKRRRIRQRADQLLAERDLARFELARLHALLSDEEGLRAAFLAGRPEEPSPTDDVVDRACAWSDFRLRCWPARRPVERDPMSAQWAADNTMVSAGWTPEQHHAFACSLLDAQLIESECEDGEGSTAPYRHYVSVDRQEPEAADLAPFLAAVAHAVLGLGGDR